jgi:DNA invertase Pin-like site-specific DNA recombinase
MPKTIYYCRVSTGDQNVNLQRDAAVKMGVRAENIYVEKASGSRADRPVLAKAIAACQRGDTLACYKLDRIGRSVAHLSRLLVELDERGVTFKTADNSVGRRAASSCTC